MAVVYGGFKVDFRKIWYNMEAREVIGNFWDLKEVRVMKIRQMTVYELQQFSERLDDAYQTVDTVKLALMMASLVLGAASALVRMRLKKREMELCEEPDFGPPGN